MTTATADGRQLQCERLLDISCRKFSVNLILDTSGSMAGARWNSVVKGVDAVLAQLDEDDKVSVTSFNHQVTTLLPFSPATAATKQRLLQQLRNTKPSHQTAFRDAIAAGIQLSQPFLQAMTQTLQLAGDDDEDDGDSGTPTGERLSHVIFFMTDGEDTSSTRQQAQVEQQLRLLASRRIQSKHSFQLVFFGLQISQEVRVQLQGLAKAGGKYTTFHEASGDMDSILGVFEKVVVTPILRCKVFDPEPLWALLQGLHFSMLNDALQDGLRVSKPSDLAGFYRAIVQYEYAIVSEAQQPDWVIWKRKQWLALMTDEESYSNAHWASCLYIMEGHVRQGAQETVWLVLRQSWVQLLQKMGAKQIQFIRPSNTLEEQIIIAAILSGARGTRNQGALQRSENDDGDYDPNATLVSGSRVKLVRQGMTEYQRLISAAGSSLVVIELQARTWCGPCRQKHPVFERLSTQFPSATFLSIPDERGCPENKALMHSMSQAQLTPTVVCTEPSATRVISRSSACCSPCPCSPGVE